MINQLEHLPNYFSLPLPPRFPVEDVLIVEVIVRAVEKIGLIVVTTEDVAKANGIRSWRAIQDGKVIVELKTGREIEPAWEKQLLNYLQATQIEVGMLFNFGPSAQFKRYVFENERTNPRKSA
jgi:hypothetical protein